MEKAWNESRRDAIRGLELMVSTSTNWKSFILTKPWSEPIVIVDAHM